MLREGECRIPLQEVNRVAACLGDDRLLVERDRRGVVVVGRRLRRRHGSLRELEFRSRSAALLRAKEAAAAPQPPVEGRQFEPVGRGDEGLDPLAAPVVDPVVEYLADRTRLTWLVRGIDPNTDYGLEFDARPGIRLGTFTGNGAQVRIGQVTGASDPVQYTVSDLSDAGGTRGTAMGATTDSLRLGYIGDRSDVDLYTFNPPTAQSVVSVRLSHLAGDGDLVLYGPPKPSGVPDRPVAQAPIADATADGSNAVEQVAPEPTDDVPLIGDATPLAVADSRGSATEAALTDECTTSTPGARVASVTGAKSRCGSYGTLPRISGSSHSVLP